MNQSAKTYSIAVVGAPETGHYGANTLELAKQLGQELAQHGVNTVTGAVTGFPMWAAMGAQEAGGMVVGFSPAVSANEHRQVYRLPTENTDMFVYTGFGHAGRDLIMVRSADAVIFGPGKIATINAFTVALEEDATIGVIEGEWTTDELFKKIIQEAEQKGKTVIFDADPRRLVEQVLKHIKERI